MTSKRPSILITNDDGIDSPGLWLMAQELSAWADVSVVAPMSEQSGMSLSITVRGSLNIQKKYDAPCGNAWSVSGTPADCIKTALSLLLINPPDIVVSGINRGSNAGKNVLYSGTVGGAVEAALRGLRAVAFSSYSMDRPEFERYAPLTTKMVQYALQAPSTRGIVLNINFPCPSTVASSEISSPILGFKMTSQGKEYMLEKPALISAPRKDEDHHDTTFHLGIQLIDSDINDETTDIYWLKRGYATCVPVFIEDLTHQKYVDEHKATFESLL